MNVNACTRNLINTSSGLIKSTDLIVEDQAVEGEISLFEHAGGCSYVTIEEVLLECICNTFTWPTVGRRCAHPPDDRGGFGAMRLVLVRGEDDRYRSLNAVCIAAEGANAGHLAFEGLENVG